MAPKVSGTPSTNTTSITAAAAFMRVYAALDPSQTMDGSASKTDSPLVVTQSKGARVDFVTTAWGHGLTG